MIKNVGKSQSCMVSNRIPLDVSPLQSTAERLMTAERLASLEGRASSGEQGESRVYSACALGHGSFASGRARLRFTYIFECVMVRARAHPWMVWTAESTFDRTARS